MIEQAELNRAFFARYGEPSRAFFPKSSSQNRAEPSFGWDPTLINYFYHLFEHPVHKLAKRWHNVLTFKQKISHGEILN